MLAFLKGSLHEKDLNRAVIEVGGVGYELLIPLSTYDRLPAVGQPVTLLTVVLLREDHIQVAGFGSAPERELFNLLISQVSGVGPKVAMSILSAMSVNQFCAAIAANDLKGLSGISGIGRRTAERLVVDLKGKLDELAPAAALAGAASRAGGQSPAVLKAAEEAIAGLTKLQVDATVARKLVQALLAELPPADCTAPNLIRRALASKGKKE